MINIGMKYTVEINVTEKDTAKAFGSGELEVMATPRMISLMEEASAKCISSELDNDSSSVGMYLNVKHLSATPIGMTVKAQSEVIAIDGRKVSFKVSACDESGLIGEGEHERFIINKEKFLSKTYAKKN
ncbi:MAG: thioesterase family protein [Clostridia bacterium]|nr:thioesterase family protein [Clostridia bacterium]